MKSLKYLFNLYLNSSIHTGIAVVCFTLVTFLEFGIAVDQNLLWFIFFGTVTSYNFVKYASVAGLHHSSLAENLKIIQVFSFFCFIALLWYTLKQDYKTLFVSTILGMLTLLYATPVLKGHQNLRNIAGIKVFVIAITATGTGVLLPLLHHYEISLQDKIIAIIQRILIHVVLMLPFEIRDLRYDHASLKTIPQLLGVKNTKIFGGVLLFLAVGLELFKTNAVEHSLPGLAIFAVLVILMLLASRTKQNKFYSSFWVEAAPIFWVLILVILGEIF
ncbi:hypothetical protein [Zunongwangia endophytica]|uniref:UbiA prenyltransferase family protein n=1 Tax=Zunongwangia endophytica TaxID=1808945 RepID=A0ABV8H2I3_9FLAO|nr:hypothetical protein [Zunongwangia endophytica]MDN3596398.1 hypothetical protein [Zunongwangia endophytica]